MSTPPPPLYRVTSNGHLLGEEENRFDETPSSSERPSQGRTDDTGKVGTAVRDKLVRDDDVRSPDGVRLDTVISRDGIESEPIVYRVYKRRFFGLLQLVLLNVIVSWDWLTFSAGSTTAAEYFKVSESAINWLSTGFLFAFVVATPVVVWTLHHGPKEAIITSSVLILIGNWVRYIGTRATGGHFGVVVFGQILIGFAQPFLLCAPTRYSDLWFTDRGRISATAVMSLANPFGGALGQLIDPFWATKASEVPNMVLYITIISSAAALPSVFVPARPPSPPSASSSIPKVSIRESLDSLIRSSVFWFIFIPFSIYVGFFNALSSLLNQILGPYGFSEDDAGICGAVLILVGLASAAIVSPITDRTHAYLPMVKALVPLIALSYLAFTWMPETRSLAGPYVVAAVLGASSFALVPVALEFLVEVTWPASPEVGSTLCWTGGQLLGAIFIIVMDALKENSAPDGSNKDHGPRPAGNMHRALVFQAVIGMLAMPFPLLIGFKLFGLGEGKVNKRIGQDVQRTTTALGDGHAEAIS